MVALVEEDERNIAPQDDDVRFSLLALRECARKAGQRYLRRGNRQHPAAVPELSDHPGPGFQSRLERGKNLLRISRSTPTKSLQHPFHPVERGGYFIDT